MKVINFVAGPGMGKSTTAAGLFYKMKVHGHNVELINEYAKELVLDERFSTLKDQGYILAKQNRKLERLKNKFDYVITDSPLFLGLCYVSEDYHKSFKPFVMDMYHSYDNMNFYLHNDGDLTYQESGRTQTKEQATEKDNEVYSFIKKNGINVVPIKIKAGDENIATNHINDIYNTIFTKEI